METKPFLEIPFRNPIFPGLGVECVSLTELRQRLRGSHYERVQRMHFHILMLFIEGQGIHEVDFVKVACKPGVIVHVRPGQLQRWLSILDADAYLILFTPDFLPPQSKNGKFDIDERLLDGAYGPSHLILEGESLAVIRSSFEAITKEYRRAGGDALSKAILHHQLIALLIQLARETVEQRQDLQLPPVQEETFRRFRQEIERQFTKTRQVDDYAQTIGCSAKTLTRACLAVAGMPPKQYIDARVALEAKRLLAHTMLGVGEIASKLGFSEPTNFAKFFRRETKALPAKFRENFKSDLGA